MNTLLALIALGACSFSLAYKVSYGPDDLWEDDGVAWDNPSSVVFNRKVYKCTDSLGCGCPMLLCTGKEDCERLDSNPITCQLTQPYEKINLQNARLEFFSKGDCKCNPL